MRRKYALIVDAREASALECVLSARASTWLVVRSCAAGPSTAFPSASRSAQSSGPTDALRLWDGNGSGPITCREARRHGIAPVPRGHPAYPFMHDGDGGGLRVTAVSYLLIETVMELLEQPIVWIVGIFAVWLNGLLNQFLPSPQRARLFITNRYRYRFLTKPPHPEDRFRFVLCWLEDDPSGRDTKIVERAFAGIKGVELVPDERIVKASGAADEWRPAMREGAGKVLDKWNADLAVVGLVKGSGKALSLWFVPREGDGTLTRADQSYKLEDVALQEEFHEDLRAQLAAVALSAVAPLADAEVRGRVLEEGLTDATGKLRTLLEGGAITQPKYRAALSLAYGNALATLGERESGPERLEQAIAAYTGALKEYTRERVPLQWATTQNNLGGALATLGERESGSERLEQAVAAYTEALKEYTRERVPLRWAMTQNNLGNALATLGERESGSERVEQAVAAYTEALKERTRERVPLDWAATQHNLGAALATLGERESGSERLEQAVAAYTEALKEYTRERVPLRWATTQNNLGAALQTLGERESGSERLEQAVAAYTEALKEYTRECVPLRWATTQNNLGNALATLGERESGRERVEQAVAAYTEALKERTRERVPLQWAMTQNNLGAALQTLGKRESGSERVEQAVAAYTEALQEYTRERVPLQWATTQNNLGNALQTLGKRESGSERLEQAVAAYTEALKERTRERVPLQWATTQNNLGNALQTLGKRESGSERLEQAVAAYTEALKERTRERVPLQWP